MAYRKRMSRKGSRRHFSKNAMRVHRKNIPGTIMRGGLRL